MSAAVEVELSELTHAFDGRGVFGSLSFSSSEACVAVVGPNGSGKSTLLRIIAGLLTPSAGEVIVKLDGEVVPRWMLRDVVGLAAPDVRLYAELSARENLGFILGARGLSGVPERVDDALAQVGLSERADDPVSELSSGLRQRAALAAAIAHDPALLLLDEPFTNLDDAGGAMLRDLIESRKNRGMLILASTSAEDARHCSARLDLEAAR